jgi:mRNA interferase MazF
MISLKTISRGDIWLVDFEPSVGTEIRKTRPAVVVQEDGLSVLERTIVVPVTSWKPLFASYMWMIRLLPTKQNGLTKESGVDTLQTKSLDNSRFKKYIGVLRPKDMDEIATAIAFCIGYEGSQDQ